MTIRVLSYRLLLLLTMHSRVTVMLIKLPLMLNLKLLVKLFESSKNANTSKLLRRERPFYGITYLMKILTEAGSELAVKKIIKTTITSRA